MGKALLQFLQGMQRPEISVAYNFIVRWNWLVCGAGFES
jgi:predicted transcriptional regulator